ncbi:MAG: SdpI family protein [Vicinamibacterales bacterium]
MTPAVIFGGFGVLLAAMGWPFIRSMVPPNRVFGLRLPVTLRSERVWYEANRRAGFDMVLGGAVIVGVSAALAGADLPTQRRLLPTIVVLVVVVLAVKGTVVAYRIARSDDLA